MQPKSLKVRQATVVFAVIYLVTFLYVASQRLTAPFELEWMEGGMIAHALRLKEGLPIYAPPSLDFVPFFYTPGYPTLLYYLSQIGFELSFTLARTVSFLSTLGTMALIYYVIHKESLGQKSLAILGVGLYAALFRTCGAFYDLARPDALMLLLLSASIVVVYYARGLRLLITAAILMSAAFLTKQTAAVFFPVLGFYAVFKHKWRGLSFVLGTILLCSITIIKLNEQSLGSFWAYIFEGHQGHIFYWKNIGLKYWRDLIFLAPLTLFLPLLWFSRYTPFKSLAWLLVLHWSVAFFQRVSTLDYPPHMYYRELFYEEPRWLIVWLPVTLVTLAYRSQQWGCKLNENHLNAYWLWIYIAGAGASAINHSTQWAYSNCFMLIGLAFSISAPLMLKDLLTIKLETNRQWCLWVMLLLQLFAWLYSPHAQIPQDHDSQAWVELKERLKTYSSPIFFPAHPTYNAFERNLKGKSATHTHQMGIRDVAYRGGVSDVRKRLTPRDRSYHWSAVITHERTHVPYLEQGYYEANRWLYRSKDSLRAKTGFLTRPQSLWLPKGPKSPRSAVFDQSTLNLNFEHNSLRPETLTWSDYQWSVDGPAFAHQPLCKKTWSAEGSCGASSDALSSKFKTKGSLQAKLILNTTQHLSLLAKVVTRQSAIGNSRPKSTRIELQILNQSGQLLARNKVYADAKWHRILMSPKPNPSHDQKRLLTLKIIDRDEQAYIMLDDIKIDQALDLQVVTNLK